MGIVNYNPVVDLMMHLGFTNYADAYKADSFPLDQNVCSLIRYAMYACEQHLLVKPSVIIAMGEPCDGELMLHEAYSRVIISGMCRFSRLIRHMVMNPKTLNMSLVS